MSVNLGGQGVQPIFILPESTTRNTGKTALKNNIAAAKLVADTVRTTLGPKGMDKMLVDSIGDITITNDGVTILDEMDIQNPAAKMMTEIAKTQKDEVGDGTTSAVVIGGELLKQSESLLDSNIHPTVITKGYRIAATKSQEILDKLAEKITTNDKKKLKDIAVTAMTGKNVTGDKALLAEIAVNAVLKIIEKDDNTVCVDVGNIKIERKEGGGWKDTKLIEGIVLDKERVHSAMPRRIKNATVLLIDKALEHDKTETDAKIRITAPEQLESFLEQEEKQLRKIVDRIVANGANVVICQKGIDDTVQYLLAQEGIFALRRVKKSDMEKLAKATGAKILSSTDNISKSDIGFAGLVGEKKMGSESMTFVEGCKNPKAVSLVIRGGTEHVVSEVERAIQNAINDLAAALSVGKCVPGGGATEVELARRLRAFSESMSGREQLAVRAFADALDIIPKTLAENGGLDPIDTLTDLKAKHDDKKPEAGLDVFTGKTANMWRLGVVEPLKVKTQAIQSATDAAIMLLRIDDIIAAGKSAAPPMPPGGGGMPPGMGGMGGY